MRKNNMANKQLVLFVSESKRRGLSENWIYGSLLENGWKKQEIDNAFKSLKEERKNLYGITIYLKQDILERIDKRAKKNLLNVQEQIEDIIRRSAINMAGKKYKEKKLDDTLVALFSRSRRGRK